MEDVSEGLEIASHASEVPLADQGTLKYADTDVNQDNCEGATLTLEVSGY